MNNPLSKLVPYSFSDITKDKTLNVIIEEAKNIGTWAGEESAKAAYFNVSTPLDENAAFFQYFSTKFPKDIYKDTNNQMKKIKVTFIENFEKSRNDRIVDLAKSYNESDDQKSEKYNSNINLIDLEDKEYERFYDDDDSGY